MFMARAEWEKHLLLNRFSGVWDLPDVICPCRAHFSLETTGLVPMTILFLRNSSSKISESVTRRLSKCWIVSFAVDRKNRNPQNTKAQVPIVFISNSEPYADRAFHRRLDIVRAFETLEDEEMV
jgi:hypothetical protein